MEMTTDLELIRKTWSSLQPFLGVDKCVDCECLQAGLTEIVMALEALPEEPERDTLLRSVREGLDLSKTHGCLGCDPCEPADVLVSFYQTRDAACAERQWRCRPSCTDASSAPRDTPERK
ncbi:MAG: hypothetical protein ACM362_10560 [Candidatus Methylomirabilota bacterium]